MEDQQLSMTVKKALWRLVPILLTGYILAYIDRINIGFAALTMNQDLGISPYIYGLVAGVFFWGYFLFEVPSNMMLQKVGARLWLSRIIISWGLIAAGCSMAQGEKSLLIMRFLLGAAEAGFYPGVILYLTYWFPKQYRAFAVATFTIGIPVSLGIGAPISTAILQLDGLMGLKGWQWLFLCEGLPTVLFGCVFLAVVPDKPKDAKWLTQDEREQLQRVIDSEHNAVTVMHGNSWFKALIDPRVLMLAVLYFINTTANLGLAFFLPQMLKRMGLTGMDIGWVTAIPYIFGTIGMLGFGYISDKKNLRKSGVVAGFIFIGMGLIGAGMATSVPVMIAMMSVGAMGMYGLKAPFWTLPSMFLAGQAAAVGIAVINSIGNLGGFAGPYAVGWIRESTGAFESGLYLLGGLGLAAALITILFVHVEKTAKAAPEKAGS